MPLAVRRAAPGKARPIDPGYAQFAQPAQQPLWAAEISVSLNITAASGAYDRRGQAPGPVRREVITELISRYVPVTGYETFVKRLSNDGRLVLRGAPGTGRATTGLRLLAKLADNVARFSPDTDLRALTAADLQPRSGYLLELNLSAGPVPRRRRPR